MQLQGPAVVDALLVAVAIAASNEVNSDSILAPAGAGMYVVTSAANDGITLRLESSRRVQMNRAITPNFLGFDVLRDHQAAMKTASLHQKTGQAFFADQEVSESRQFPFAWRRLTPITLAAKC